MTDTIVIACMSFLIETPRVEMILQLELLTEFRGREINTIQFSITPMHEANED